MTDNLQPCELICDTVIERLEDWRRIRTISEAFRIGYLGQQPQDDWEDMLEREGDGLITIHEVDVATASPGRAGV